jgi:hypothetical protein
MYQILLIIKRFLAVEAPKRKKRRNALLLSGFLALLSAVFIAGYGIVYTRSYNIMNKTPLTVFEITESGEETVITVLGKSYIF